LRTALLKLPHEMREALIAVGWRGLSYQEAARACDCPVGTVRSRVHRARECLAALLDIESPVAGSHGWSGTIGLGVGGLGWPRIGERTSSARTVKRAIRSFD